MSFRDSGALYNSLKEVQDNSMRAAEERGRRTGFLAAREAAAKVIDKLSAIRSEKGGNPRLLEFYAAVATAIRDLEPPKTGRPAE